jgi:hypothetical protein
MSMLESDLREAIDQLDSGLSAAPDVTAIVAGGRRRRRRARLVVTAAGLATAAAVVPLALAVTGDGAARPDPTSPAAAVDPAVLGHGADMAAAVATVFPDASLADEVQLDSWGEDDQGSSVATSSDPVRWETLFAWRQAYDVGGLAKLTVDSDRLAPDDRLGLEPVCDTVSPRQHGCTERLVGDRLVIVEDGLPGGGEWLRVVSVVDQDSERGYRSRVTVAATAVGDTWAAAKPHLPSIEEITDLALDGRLVLPEPERYPTKP